MFEKNSEQNPATSAWLKNFVESDGGVSGTIHERQKDLLILKAAHNIPPPVVSTVRTIVKGKGMAGLAWQRGLSVSTCNLQTDTSGDVRPGAKSVGAKAAVAIPIGMNDEGPTFVVGIAYMTEVDLDEEKLAQLQDQAESLLDLDRDA